MLSLEFVRKEFTDWAKYYDATHSWTLPYRREARLALNIQAGDHVLDLACGTGLNFPHLQELGGEESRITGVDITPAMLDIARRRIGRYGWKNVKLAEADAANLPFPDESFDKVICTFAMSIIPDYIRAIEETWRVLVPGGLFVVLNVKISNNRLTRWLNRRLHTCGFDVTHRTVEELKRVFSNVKVREHWRGLIYIAVATKG